MDTYFHPTPYNGCDYLSVLGLKLNHVSKRGPWYQPQWFENRHGALGNYEADSQCTTPYCAIYIELQPSNRLWLEEPEGRQPVGFSVIFGLTSHSGNAICLSRALPCGIPNFLLEILDSCHPHRLSLIHSSSNTALFFLFMCGVFLSFQKIGKCAMMSLWYLVIWYVHNFDTFKPEHDNRH